MFVALTKTKNTVGRDDSLHVDNFGLSIGPVSVGLPLHGTSDDVYRRYLDLIGILQNGPLPLVDLPLLDVEALADATNADIDFVTRRLAALQRDA